MVISQPGNSDNLTILQAIKNKIINRQNGHYGHVRNIRMVS